MQIITATTTEGKPATGFLEKGHFQPETCIVIIHGHNSDADRNRFLILAKYFEQHDFAVCRWQAIRPRLSEERYRVLPLKDEIAQIRALMTKLGTRYKQIIIVGHSQGGLAGLVLATEGLAKGLVQLVPVIENRDNVRHKLATAGYSIDELKAGETAEVVLSNGKSFVYDASYFEDLLMYDVPALYKRWKGPTLIVGGTRDITITMSEIERGLALANEPKRLLTIDDQHNFSDETALMLAANIVAWIRRELS